MNVVAKVKIVNIFVDMVERKMTAVETIVGHIIAVFKFTIIIKTMPKKAGLQGAQATKWLHRVLMLQASSIHPEPDQKHLDVIVFALGPQIVRL